MKKSRHSIPAMIFHWGFLIIFIYGILKQVEDINQLSDISLLKFEIIFATLMLILLIIRYFYMSRTQVTSLPDDTSMFQKRAAKVVHLSLYINLAVIPITGLVIGILYWLGLKSGIFIEFTVGLHELSISTMYWLIAIHVSAAIFHRFKNDGVWSSMVPLLPEKKTSD
ncbi:cytochrome b/b6 domain-containing protein [Amylibacter sp.]|jgi:cytochrome b561|nr:cytochrome b/b6 domain-containing protein [Amylibacter sp.]MDB9919277.1 cytochrome b/b6 domain-containing protein [Amylibacter sp.]MDC1288708.1 cytochrome b/b6 domain-containing protein [Amylibacter sp.]|tara:strand:+ start:15172 stop:15675 length:504 start_codon:yes stop_codon:yes gene_type:complete